MGLKEGSRKARGQKVLFLSLILRGMLVGAGHAGQPVQGVAARSSERESAQLTCLSKEHNPGKIPKLTWPCLCRTTSGENRVPLSQVTKKPDNLYFYISKSVERD